MDSFFARATAATVFFTLVGSFVVLMVVAGGLMSMDHSIMTTGIGRFLLLGMMLSVMALMLRWIWVCVHIAHAHSHGVGRLGLNIFRWSLAYLVLDLTVFAVFFSTGAFGKEAFGVFMIMHMGAMVASLLWAVSAASLLARGLVGERAHLGHTLGYLFALSYWPIGIWFIQPKIRRLAGA